MWRRAREKADEILSQARREAERILRNAKAEAENFMKNRIEPIFAFVPEKGLNKRVEELRELVSLAVGIRLEI